jgi:HEAT repeat protein
VSKPLEAQTDPGAHHPGKCSALIGKGARATMPGKLTHKQAVEIALADPAARAASSQIPLVVERNRLYAEQAQGVLADLASVRFPGLEEVGELRHRRLSYKAAVPVLLEWLPRVSYLMLSEDIVRTLSVGFARKLAAPEFLSLFRDPPFVQDPLRPVTSEPAEDLIELAPERRFGAARSQIVAGLPKVKDERVGGVLISLLDDPTVCAFAIAALGRMRFTTARAAVEAALTDPDKNVRDQAKKSLKRLEQA